MAKVVEETHLRKETRKKIRRKRPDLPPATYWRTSDMHEFAKRRLRAREERHRITNLDPKHPVFRILRFAHRAA